MRSALFGCAVAVAFCVAVPSAQQQPAPQQQPQQQTTPAPDATPAHKVYVLTGCLAARPDAPAVFTLSDASAVGDLPPAGPVAPPSADTPVGTSGRKPSYELQAVSGINAQGKDEAALKVHAGHRVEVIIRPVEVIPPAPSAAGQTVATATAKPEEQAPVRYTVTEIKAVTGTCS